MKRVAATSLLLALLLSAVACTREVERVVVVTPTRFPATATTQPAETPQATATPALAPTPPQLEPESRPPPTPLPDRANCAEISGTEYRSPAERQWYLDNCIPTAVPATATTLVPAPAQAVSPPPALAALAIPGATYTGTTSQGKLFEFVVTADGTGISELSYGKKLTCKPEGTPSGLVKTSSEGDVQITGGPPVPIVDNAFSFGGGESRTVGRLDEVSGRFTSGTKAEGVAQFYDDQIDFATSRVVARCDTGPLTWTAFAQ